MEQGQGDSSANNRATTPTTPTTSQYSYSQLRSILRQNSEKMGLLAEEVILPPTKRSVKKVVKPREVEMVRMEQTEAAAPLREPSPVPPSDTKIVISEKAEKEAEVPFKPPCQFPVFMLLISIIQVLLFYNMDVEDLMLFFGFDPYRRYELWRYVTILLAHSSTSHLWGNVIFQLILGVLLEMVHGWKRIAIIYFASVVGGSLFITVISPQVYGVGASAGVYGLLFAHLSTIILNWNEMDRKCCRLFWLLAYIAYDIGINAAVKFVFNIDTNTSHAGHIGGAITGFLVAILVLRNFAILPWEKKLQKFCAGTLVTIFTVAVLVNVAFPSNYLEAPWNFEYWKTYALHLIKTVHDSPEDSVVRHACEENDDCKALLDQYKHNGTLPFDE